MHLDVATRAGKALQLVFEHHSKLRFANGETPPVLVVGQFPPPVHGSNVMARQLFHALESTEFSPIFVDKGFSKKHSEVGNFSLVKVLRALSFFRRIILAALRARPQLCIYFISVTKGAFLVEAVSIGLLRLFGVRYLLYFHGTGLRALAEENRVFGYLVTRVLSKAERGVPVSQTLAQDVTWCIPPERLRVIPNAIEDIPELARDPARDPRVLYLSNLIPEKGPLEFMRAAQLVHRAASTTKFVVAGGARRPTYMEQLQAFVSDGALEGVVTFAGPVHGEAKDALLAACDIFVFPSLLHEAFGLVNLEAMRASLPVVAFNVGAVSEVVVDGVTGFVVKPNDVDALAHRVLMLVQDPALRERMGTAGRQRFEDHYTIAQFERLWAETLEAVLVPNRPA